jgi:uncharacterized coiled-coil protein SlyX
MTQKEKISKLIELAGLMTNRLAKVEKDSLDKIIILLDRCNKLQKRIEELEEKTINIIA